MLIDTHCHLNFKAFQGREQAVIKRANRVGVTMFIVPGADLKSSQRAVNAAKKFSSVYAAIGIHPHHVPYHPGGDMEEWEALKSLVFQPKVVAIGEVGIDKYKYENTKYLNYQITPGIVQRQKQVLIKQIKLALEYNKALILHNRQGTDELLTVLKQNWDEKLAKHTVFHCCEADEQLLDFAIKHRIYLGIDGDLSWSRKKQRFIANVPLDQLVLETDSPYLKPKLNNNWPKEITPPKYLEKEELNEPKNIAIIRDLVAYFQQVKISEVEKRTTENAVNLFRLSA